MVLANGIVGTLAAELTRPEPLAITGGSATRALVDVVSRCVRWFAEKWKGVVHTNGVWAGWHVSQSFKEILVFSSSNGYKGESSR